MSAPFDKLLAPNSISDWLDRRAGLEQVARKAANLAFAQAWLNVHHPRFGGQS